MDQLVNTINDVIAEEVPSELTILRKEKNRLSNLAYRLRGLPDAPVHTLHKAAANALCNRIVKVKKEHWNNWLEEAMSKDIYVANRFTSNPPSDYSNARIPLLKTSTPDGNSSLLSTNSKKVEALAATFFLPPPSMPIVLAMAYPEPLNTQGLFTCEDICKVVSKLKPYKASGLNGIPNVVLQKCINTIINHLYYIFWAILELDTYPSRWLAILTVVLCKPGKAAYNIAKAYHPIGLLEMLSKLFSTLVAADLSYITEKHDLLPPTQFRGRPCRCTTDTIHLITTKIKDAWRVGKVTSALFLNIQATFPNTIKAQLLHNMKSRCVPTQYIQLFNKMLSGHKTQLHFDNYISEPIQITNGTTQGCPLSMLLYTYYNADLIDIAKGKFKLSTGFVDDVPS